MVVEPRRLASLQPALSEEAVRSLCQHAVLLLYTRQPSTLTLNPDEVGAATTSTSHPSVVLILHSIHPESDAGARARARISRLESGWILPALSEITTRAASAAQTHVPRRSFKAPSERLQAPLAPRNKSGALIHPYTTLLKQES